MFSPANRKRTFGLIVWSLTLPAIYWFLADSNLRVDQQIHTLFETSATLLALSVAVLLFVSYLTNKDRRFLFFAIGFLGTAIFDANHCIVTSTWVNTTVHNSAGSVSGIKWNWNSSRLFLSLLMFISCWRGIALSATVRKKQIKTRNIYIILGSISVVVMVLFTLFPVASPYSDGMSVGRPIEFPPAIFFLTALLFLWRAKSWKTDIFDYWIVLFLISSIYYQALYMPSSKELFDSPFTMAHLLKLTSYIFVFIGLILKVHGQFIASVKNAEEVKELNQALQKEIAEKKELSERMKLAAISLEEKVKERTRELDDSRIAALNMMEDANEAKSLAEEAKEELDMQAKKLAVSNKELEQFAYVASHDLQEPLRTVGSFVQLLSQRYQGKLEAQADEYIQFIVEGVTRMRQLINDLLTFSRVETKGGKFVPSDLEMVLSEALANLKAAIVESNAKITHDPLPMAMVDKGQIAQLLQNLIGNALKFKGTEVPKVHIGVKKQDGEWLLSVKDNGIGIDPEFSDKIFVIFQRLHTRAEYPGTGIGLSLCKKIVERHGGRIWVDSTPGRGATFNFTLPDNMGEENEYRNYEQANRNTVG